MKKEDEQVIKDVKFILNSGDTGIIHTLKVTIPAYLHCIAVNRQQEELLAEKRRLESGTIE
ncbi:MAG: hypothetical protein M0009_03945 [Deltaproteobacteria bacterium]|nr:hypothetical protein [Deltaproteobacteria bacterium]